MKIPILEKDLDIEPCLKVRNNSYLKMIYGIDFDFQYKNYLEKRNIKYKLNCSKRDYKTAKELLKINDNHLNKDNEGYRKLLFKVIGNEKHYNKLDKNL